MRGIVCEGLRALLAWVVIKELDDEGLLGVVLLGALFGCFSGGWSLRRALGQGSLRGYR